MKLSQTSCFSRIAHAEVRLNDSWYIRSRIPFAKEATVRHFTYS